MMQINVEGNVISNEETIQLLEITADNQFSY